MHPSTVSSTVTSTCSKYTYTPSYTDLGPVVDEASDRLVGEEPLDEFDAFRSHGQVESGVPHLHAVNMITVFYIEG